jgi:hypothetical protein
MALKSLKYQVKDIIKVANYIEREFGLDHKMLRKKNCRNNNGVVIVYDITAEASFTIQDYITKHNLWDKEI